MNELLTNKKIRTTTHAFLIGARKFKCVFVLILHSLWIIDTNEIYNNITEVNIE